MKYIDEVMKRRSFLKLFTAVVATGSAAALIKLEDNEVTYAAVDMAKPGSDKTVYAVRSEAGHMYSDEESAYYRKILIESTPEGGSEFFSRYTVDNPDNWDANDWHSMSRYDKNEWNTNNWRDNRNFPTSKIASDKHKEAQFKKNKLYNAMLDNMRLATNG